MRGWLEASFDDSHWDTAPASAGSSAAIPLTDTAPQLVLAEIPDTTILAASPGLHRTYAPTCCSTLEQTWRRHAKSLQRHLRRPGDVTFRRAEALQSDGRTLNQNWLLAGAKENCTHISGRTAAERCSRTSLPILAFGIWKLKGLAALPLCR